LTRRTHWPKQGWLVMILGARQRTWWQPSWIFNKKVKIFNNSQTVKKFLIKVFNKNLVKILLKF
jgi:hypothetical protein